MAMQNFRTYQLALSLYKATERIAVTGELKDQMKRASMSIVLNLAEATGRNGKDRLRFFRIAQGSLREVQACLDLLGNQEAAEIADHVGASLYRLMKNPGRGSGF